MLPVSTAAKGGSQMGGLLLSLLPVTARMVLSPVAILALIAVLLSRQARTNGMAFLLGWTVGLLGVLGGLRGLFDVLDLHARDHPPQWVPILRIVLGVGFLASAMVFLRRGRQARRQMAEAVSPLQVRRAAAPRLTGSFATVHSFTPPRTFLFGLGLFVLTPVRLACCAIAALDLSLSPVADREATVAALLFCLAGITPIAVPVVLAARGTDGVDHQLRAMREWLVSHTGYVNAALMVLIAAIQIGGGVTGLLDH